MIGIGSGRRRDPAGLVDLLLDCHTRIRTFSALAVTLAEVEMAERSHIEDAAHRVRRYFDEALPLHARDEEATVLPRLVGAEPVVDAALERMRQEHGEHEPQLAELVEICWLLEVSGDRIDELRGRLTAVSDALVPALEAHLAEEERTVFPALVRLIERRPELEAEMVAELRARRQPSAAPA
jgi:iron-sulfur cluster repair protein YtfE (RIC family)